MNMLNEESCDDRHLWIGPSSSPQPEIVYRILIVEDDASLAHLEAHILTAKGYAVKVVDTGEIAVTVLDTTIPDLVVLDLDLPGSLNGWDVFHILRKYASVPVLLTTSIETTVRQYLRTSGETRLTLDHLPKPYPMQAFLTRIQRMLMIAPE